MIIAIRSRLIVSVKERPLLWSLFILYTFLLCYTGLHHELWGDEVHSWNIAKASHTYFDLLANKRYEGHPPAWYTLLWIITAFTHQVIYMQTAQLLIAVTIAWLILFRSPFALSTRLLLPFGYYFLFEYGVLSRNYALGVLFACCICYILRKDLRYKSFLYYLLLFCLSNVHLFSLLLAASIHIYFLLLYKEQQKNLRRILLHALLGVLILLPAAYFIHIPSDSEVDISAWTHSWTTSQLGNFYQPILRAFLPIPAWWKYNFWNTEFLLEIKDNYTSLKEIVPIVALAFIGYLIYILWKNKKSLALFVSNLVFSYLLSVTAFSIGTARHAGFLYIGFLVAWWLYCSEYPVPSLYTRMVNALLVIQIAAGAFAMTKDIQLPFSNTDKVTSLIRDIPSGEKLITDGWTMNAISAFTDKPVYCVDVQRELSFLLFDSHLKAVDKDPHRYTDGLLLLFEKTHLRKAYMISQSAPQLLARVDSLLNKTWHLTLIEKREGAIEQGSNVYLYRVEAF